MNIMFKTISIIAITPEFQMYTKSKSLHKATSEISVVTNIGKELLEDFLAENPKIMLRRCGIRVSNFEENKKKQGTLEKFLG